MCSPPGGLWAGAEAGAAWRRVLAQCMAHFDLWFMGFVVLLLDFFQLLSFAFTVQRPARRHRRG